MAVKIRLARHGARITIIRVLGVGAGLDIQLSAQHSMKCRPCRRSLDLFPPATRLESRPLSALKDPKIARTSRQFSSAVPRRTRDEKCRLNASAPQFNHGLHGGLTPCESLLRWDFRTTQGDQTSNRASGVPLHKLILAWIRRPRVISDKSPSWLTHPIPFP